MIWCPDCRGGLAGGEQLDEQRATVVRCEECGKAFRLTFGLLNHVTIEPILDTVDRPESLAETFPECAFDFPAAMRERIIEEVTLHGKTFRCAIDLSSAFAGWEHSQIDQWCEENSLMISAAPDGRITIRRTPSDALPGWFDEMESRLNVIEGTIRAEVEAMDWLDRIGE